MRYGSGIFNKFENQKKQPDFFGQIFYTMTKKIIAFALIALITVASGAIAQKLKNSRTSGYYTYIFRLKNSEAEWIITKYKLRSEEKYFLQDHDHVAPNPQYFETRVDSFHTDSMFKLKLAAGYYICATVKESQVEYTFNPQYALTTSIIPHNRDLIVSVHTKNNVAVTDAAVNIDGKAVPWDNTIGAYRLKGYHKRGMLQVKSGAADDCYNLNNYSYVPLKGLRKVAGIVLWPVKVVYGTVFCPVYTFRYLFKKRSKAYAYFGYLATNKPEYLPKDTVKIKAYVVNKKGKPLTKKLFMNVSGYSNNFNYEKVFHKELKPESPGNYSCEFVVGDSLKVNTSYWVTPALNDKLYPTSLENVTNTFYLEDYQLDETSYSVTTDKDYYSRGDNIVISASGKDINGFPLKDAKVKVTAEVQWVDDFTGKVLFVPHKLWEGEEDLLPSGVTKIIVPDSIFLPAAALSVKITALFNNSNNESQEIVKMVNIGNRRQNLDVKLLNDSLTMESDDVKDKQRKAEIREFTATDTVMSQSLTLPAKIKIDAFAKGYDVKYGTLHKTLSLSKESALVEAYNVRTSDSMKIDLLNPRKLAVLYIIYDGEKEIERGTVNKDFHWKRRDVTKDPYFIKYRYTWAGQVEALNYDANVEDKKLVVDVKQPEVIFPGQETDVKVNVSDYKGQAVKDVNLTALAVNAEFDKTNVPSVPLMEKSKRGMKGNNSFSMLTPYISGREILNKAWVAREKLDTIPYYKMLYPKNGITLFYDSILTNNAQFAPFVVKYGYLESIKMMWLDDTLIYVQEYDHNPRYSFIAKPGYHKLKLRTMDHEYTLEKMLLKKNFKLDLSICALTLPAGVTAEKAPKKLTKEEVATLNKSMTYFSANNSGTGWFWQDDKIYHENLYYADTYVGPFDTSKVLHYYINSKSGTVNVKRGYALKYDNDVWEIKTIPFANDIRRFKLKWNYYQYKTFGDTAMTLADVYKAPETYTPQLYKLSSIDSGYKKGTGTLLFKFTSDSLISYVRLEYPDHTVSDNYYGYTRIFYNREPGDYTIYLVTPSGTLFWKNILNVGADGITCVEIGDNDMMTRPSSDLKTKKNNQGTNGCIVYGQVTDYDTGDPIPYATISASYTGDNYYYATTDATGHYTLKFPDRLYSNLDAGKYGYNNSYKYLYNEGAVVERNFELYKISYNTAKQHLNFAAAGFDDYSYDSYWRSWGGYNPPLRLTRFQLRRREYSAAYGDYGGGKKKARYIYSAPINEEYDGRAEYDQVEETISKSPGVTRGGNWMAGKDLALSEVTVKGSSGLMNGRLLDSGERNYDKSHALVKSKDETGMDTTGMNALMKQNAGNLFKNTRSHFSDYGYWKNNLMTDKNGQATFRVKFPDNLTQWASYVLAMDGSKHSGTGFVKTKAYNLINASLSLPRFLLPGDTANVIGKSINLGKDSVNIRTAFYINNLFERSKNVLLVNSNIESLPISTKVEDSLTVQYSLATPDGYSDGEKRTIPVFPVGVNESYGKFYILEKDTTFQLKMNPDSGKIEVFADGNYLSFLLHDIDHIADFPYYCMEQTSSKLMALVMKENIMTTLGEKFHENGDIHKLIKKLEKGQSDDGSFGWWPNTKANIWMTSYILNALYKAHLSGYESKALEKGKAFLEKWIGMISVTEDNNTTLEALNILSEMKAQVEFDKYIKRLKYSDLDLTHKFMVIKILQENKLPFDMKEVLKEKKQSMLGGLYWGADKQSLSDNSIEASILAYQIFRNDSVYKKELGKIRNYFFEKKYHGNWQNTVEAASILETILPDILKGIPGKITPSAVTLNDKTIKDFPYKSELKEKTVSISKKGTSPVFITLYQTIWSKDEKSISKDFTVNTSFEVDHDKVTTLASGQPTLLVADVEVKKTAEYVMIEIPIPAGCSYGENDGKESSVEVHREYFKNKTNIFCENLTPGKYRFVIEVQPRFTGSYTLNPAKAELMYFPTFFGREGIRRVRIK